MKFKQPVLDRLVRQRIILGMIGMLFASSSACAIQTGLDRPGQREFVRDLAGMLDKDATERIRAICDRLLTDMATPIIVVTISEKNDYGGGAMSFETFATSLFNQWGIGRPTLNDEPWNTGILLLISKGDRKARIELGRGWGRSSDGTCLQIMDDHIIFYFKQGRFSKGIEAGVIALDKMARNLELPMVPRPWWHYALVVAAIGLAIFTIVSLIRRGASGWAWIFWAAVFAVLGIILYNIATNASKGGSSSGGGYSGGSFGGGSSGGGGASGSW